MASPEHEPSSLVPPPEGEPESNVLPDKLAILFQARSDTLGLLLESTDEEEQQRLSEKLGNINDDIRVHEGGAAALEAPDADDPSPPNPEVLTANAAELKAVTLDDVKNAPKYKVIREKRNPYDPHAVAMRAQAIEEVFAGQSRLIRSAMEQVTSDAGLKKAWKKQNTNKVPKIIPDAFFKNKEFVEEMNKLGQRIESGDDLRTILQEGYKEGINDDKTKLLALKSLGAMMQQQYSPNGNQERWKALSENQRSYVRVGEMLSTSATLNLLRIRMEQDTLPEDIAEYHRHTFGNFLQSDDIPDFFKEDIKSVTKQLGEYIKLQADHSNVLNDKPAVGDGETVAGSAGDTTLNMPAVKQAPESKDSSTENTTTGNESTATKPVEDTPPAQPKAAWEKIKYSFSKESESKSNVVLDVKFQPVAEAPASPPADLSVSELNKRQEQLSNQIDNRLVSTNSNKQKAVRLIDEFLENKNEVLFNSYDKPLRNLLMVEKIKGDVEREAGRQKMIQRIDDELKHSVHGTKKTFSYRMDQWSMKLRANGSMGRSWK